MTSQNPALALGFLALGESFSCPQASAELSTIIAILDAFCFWANFHSKRLILQVSHQRVEPVCHWYSDVWLCVAYYTPNFPQPFEVNRPHHRPHRISNGYLEWSIRCNECAPQKTNCFQAKKGSLFIALRICEVLSILRDTNIGHCYPPRSKGRLPGWLTMTLFI